MVTRSEVLHSAQARVLQRMSYTYSPAIVAAARGQMASVGRALDHSARLAALRSRVLKAGLAVLAAAAVASASGCAFMQSEWRSEDARKVQIAASGLIVVDTAQTYNFAESGCIRELNPLAFGGDEEPSREKVLAYSLPYLVSHWYLGKWVDQRWSGKWQQRLYWSLTFGGHGVAVGSNLLKGISPLRTYRCSP